MSTTQILLADDHTLVRAGVRALLEGLPEVQVGTRDNDFARGKFGGLKVDVHLTSNPLFEEVRKRFTAMQRFVEQDIPCATVEGLVLLKLYALPSL